jgi:SPP1 gp7 family putative phage head morphogenesis protein
LNDVRTVDQTYNSQYLRAEYNFANASAEMAAKWEQFAADGDRYYLQYRTAGDDHVRPEHERLNGVTLPVDDPFWDEYYPPNGWNCRCTVAQVRKSKATPSDPQEARLRGAEATANDRRGMFRFNPGKEKVTFPKYNPYTISRCRDCDRANGKSKLAKEFLNEGQLCEACAFIRSCEMGRHETIAVGAGRVEISDLVKRTDSDYDKIMQVASAFAAEGKVVAITPKMGRTSTFKYDCYYGDLKGTAYYGKCPDLKVGDKWYELEGYSSSNPKNALRNMMNHGLKQASRIIIERPEGMTDAFIKRSIKHRQIEGQNIEEVWLIEKSGIRCLYKKSEE